jgi:hypothetical protein
LEAEGELRKKVIGVGKKRYWLSLTLALSPGEWEVALRLQV